MQATNFLNQQLWLTVNPKIDVVSKASKGISYLGVDIWSSRRKLQQKVRTRISERATVQNVASYKSLVLTHDKTKKLRELGWLLSNDI